MWVGGVDKLLGNRVLTVEEGTYNYGMWVGKKKSYGDILQLDGEVQIHDLKNMYVRMFMCMLSCSLSCVRLYETQGLCLSGSSDHAISQARILEWVAISSSRGTSQPKD